MSRRYHRRVESATPEDSRMLERAATWSLLRLVTFVGLGVLVPFASAEQVTVRLTPPPWRLGGCSSTNSPTCGNLSVEDPSKLVVDLLTAEVACLRFVDPTPPLSKVTSIDLRMAYQPVNAPAVPLTVHMDTGLSGGASLDSLVGTFIRSSALEPFRCEPPYSPLLLEIVTGVNHDDGIRGYVHNGTNSLVFEQGMFFEFLDIIVNYKPPPKVEFELTPTTDEKQRRVLIKRWREHSPYFSDAQANLPAGGAGRDGRIRIAGTVTDEDGPVANQKVYLRSVDPPDVAPYVPVASRRSGDNADGLGSLDLSTVTTNGSGRFETVLTVTDHASGDNYQIEASTVPSFGFKQVCDATNNCHKSGVLTAWKRIYTEVDRMFRKGAMLTQDIPQCTTTECSSTVVISVDDAGTISKANRLRLVHAPRFDGAGPPSFYFEDVDVIKVNKKTDTVEITRPVQSFYGPDTISNAAFDYLADAVGQITGFSGAPDDFFNVNSENIDDVMNAAFVDYVHLSDDPAPFIPFQESVAGVGTPNDEITLLARKWFRSYGDENVQHLIGARAANDPLVLGRTTSRIDTNFAFIFVDSLNAHSPKAKQGEWRFNGEVTAHEIGHEWQVNPTDSGGHCSARQHSSATAWCLMHGSYSDSGICQGTCPEFYDGIVTFHYLSAEPNSEYLHIRHRAEPFPQQ